MGGKPMSNADVMRALTKIARAIASKESFESVLQIISAEIAGLIRAETCAVMIVENSTGQLIFKEAYGLTMWEKDNIRFKVGEGIAGWVAEKHKPALVADTKKDKRYKEFKGQKRVIKSMIAAPLMTAKNLLGVVTATHPDKDFFTDDNLKMLSYVASNIALEIENTRLRELSVTDELTNVFNRRYFMHRLEEEISRSARFREPLTICFLDLDGFKKVNDTLGHPEGDRLLVRIGAWLNSKVRKHDVVARYGGDEFILLLANTDLNGAMTVCKRVNSEIFKHDFGIKNGDLKISVSIGIATYPDHANSGADLVSRADKALLEAKAAGKNRAVAAGSV